MGSKGIAALVLVGIILVVTLIGYGATHETIPAGYVGYVYDRTANENDNVIPGTSVINEKRTGRITVNPFTQDVLKYPTTIVSENWTCLAEGDNKHDMSMQIASSEGKNIDADVYLSVRPIDIGKIVASFGTKEFEDIVNNDIYGLVKGRLSSVSQNYSVYDMQSSRTEIQDEVTVMLRKTLDEIYGVELIRFELGTLNLPDDIQAKIDQKTQAQNDVELAKLARQKQDEINQQVVDQQKAQSEKELLQRQAEADANAYEITRQAEAQLEAKEVELEIARLNVEKAELEKEAELEKQRSFTEEYFRDKELDVQIAAVQAINPSIKTIITNSDGDGYSALVGVREILNSLE